MSEAAVVRRILKALRERGAKCIKCHPSGTEVGMPDIAGCHPKSGMFLIEVKDPSGRHPVTPIQRHRLKEWHRAGARTGVAQGVEEALAIVFGDDALADHDRVLDPDPL